MVIIGAYWSQRKETKEAVAARLAAFMKVICKRSEVFATWFGKAGTRTAALRLPLDLNNEAIEVNLSINRRDADRKPIQELGFSFSAWNGKETSFSATLGAYSQYAGNAVVLRVGEEDRLNLEFYRVILEDMIHFFDPEYAAVATDECLARVGAKKPWEVGLITYKRGEGIIERTHQ
jgi:hypothetical protein